MKTMSCEQARMLFDEKIDGVISDKDNALLEKHLVECESCRREYEQLKKTCAFLGDFAVDVPSELHERVMASIKKEPKPRASAWRYLRPLSVASVAALLCLTLLHTPLFKGMFSAEKAMDVAPDQKEEAENMGNIFDKDEMEAIDGTIAGVPSEEAPSYTANAVAGTALSLHFTDEKNAVLYRNENGRSEAFLEVIYSKTENTVTIEKDGKKASLILEGDTLIPTDEALLDALLSE